MEFRQLRYFIAVAEARNVSLAARLLNVSQPPLTRQVRALEREIGHDLFIRSSTGVRLTPAGENFLVDARKTLAQADAAVQRSRAAALGRGGQVSIGYTGSSIYTYLPPLLKQFAHERPELEINLHPMRKAEQMEALRASRLDLGFGRYYPPVTDLAVEVIGRERLFVAHTAGDPRFAKRRVTPQILSGGRLILYPRDGRPNFADEVIRYLSNAALPVRIAHLADDVTASLALVASGMGTTVVPEPVARLNWPGVTFAAMAGEAVYIPVHCIYDPVRKPPAVAALLQLIRKRAAGFRRLPTLGSPPRGKS